ncbi:MAG: pyrroloquinoline-quinone synthase PqqC [Polyangiaceae bacterium]
MSAQSPADFLDRLRAEGRERYHDRHPFHLRMHEGTLSRKEIQAWVLNRYYYQTRIPIKDAILLSKSEDPAWRRKWIHRIHDHDGTDGTEGGLALWLRLAGGVGLDVETVRSLRQVLPAVRFACDSYVQLVRERTLVEAVASSLTEFFAPDLMAQRLAAWEKHYPWVDPAVQDYFRARVTRAREDSKEAVDFVLASAVTGDMQDRCVAALVTKCQILWAILDAVEASTREP